MSPREEVDKEYCKCHSDPYRRDQRNLFQVHMIPLPQRLGSGDGEREASMTRLMPYEPLPASVLFALVLMWDSVMPSLSLAFLLS
jgi:hypothetical protein